jgi:hypothetical protein
VHNICGIKYLPMNVLALTLSLVSLLCLLSGCMMQPVRDDNATGTAPTNRWSSRYARRRLLLNRHQPAVISQQQRTLQQR